MSHDTPYSDLYDRLVGKRFYDTSIDEGFTVVDVRPPLVCLQYDDGRPWDEACAPDMFPEPVANMIDVDGGGIDAAKYRPLPGGGPTLDAACEDGDHVFYPRPSYLGIDGTEAWHASHEGTSIRDTYLNIVRCQKCALSGSVLVEFLGHATPKICDRCEEEVLPSEADIAFAPTPEWPDCFLCGDCAEAVEDEYEPSPVECYSCGSDLGTDEENHAIHPTSGIGTELGADGDDGAIYLCHGCWRSISDTDEG